MPTAPPLDGAIPRIDPCLSGGAGRGAIDAVGRCAATTPVDWSLSAQARHAGDVPVTRLRACSGCDRVTCPLAAVRAAACLPASIGDDRGTTNVHTPATRSNRSCTGFAGFASFAWLPTLALRWPALAGEQRACTELTLWTATVAGGGSSPGPAHVPNRDAITTEIDRRQRIVDSVHSGATGSPRRTASRSRRPRRPREPLNKSLPPRRRRLVQRFPCCRR